MKDDTDMTAEEFDSRLNDSERRAVEGVQILWPYLSMDERLKWVDRLRHLFGDFHETVKVLSGH